MFVLVVSTTRAGYVTSMRPYKIYDKVTALPPFLTHDLPGLLQKSGASHAFCLPGSQ